MRPENKIIIIGLDAIQNYEDPHKTETRYSWPPNTCKVGCGSERDEWERSGVCLCVSWTDMSERIPLFAADVM